MQRDEEDAWRAIVENYGERVLGPETAVGEAATPYDDDRDGPGDHPRDDVLQDGSDPSDEGEATQPDPEERFVPPTPEPQPLPSPDRGIAWAGLLGSPLVLVVCVLANVSLPSWLGYLLVTAFVAGFLYLVITMKNGPGDPWDDGARV